MSSKTKRCPLQSGVLYQYWISVHTWICSSIALNADVEVRCAPRALAEVGEALRKTILQLHADFLSEDGRRVDYAGIKDSPAFKSYKDIARQLQVDTFDTI